MLQPNAPIAGERKTRVSIGAQALWLAMVFIFSLLLRLHDIAAKPFWMDEVTTVKRASLPLGPLIADSLYAHHSPVFFVVTSWMLPFGADEFWMRLPPAFFGALSCALGFGIARHIGGLKAGLFTGLLFALSPVMVQYGQEARSYTMVICAILAGLWGLAVLAEPAGPDGDATGRHYAWATYILGTTLALNILSVALFWFLAANLAAIAIAPLQGRQFRRQWLLAQLLIITLCLPWLIALLLGEDRGLTNAVHWVPPLNWARIWWSFSGTYLLYITSVVKVQVFASSIPGIGAVVLALAISGLIAIRKQRGVSTVLLIAVLCLPAGLLTASVVRPILMPRYLLWSAAPYFICAGLGFNLLPKRLQWPALGVFGLLLAINLAPYYHDETKPRWDVAAADMAGFRPGDLLLQDDTRTAYMLSFNLKRKAIDLPAAMCTTDIARALAWRNSGNRVWAVQGQVGTVMYFSRAQFLQRIAVLGAPQFSERAGQDILLLRFDGKAAPLRLTQKKGN